MNQDDENKDDGYACDDDEMMMIRIMRIMMRIMLSLKMITNYLCV